MQDLCRAAPYIRMSSNPTGGFLKSFPKLTFWECIFSCAFLLFFAYCLFVLIFCVFFVVVLYCIFLTKQ